jgi:hypothetical protein
MKRKSLSIPWRIPHTRKLYTKSYYQGEDTFFDVLPTFVEIFISHNFFNFPKAFKVFTMKKFFLKLSCFCIPLNQIYFKCESKVSIACEHFGVIGY